MKNQIRFWAAVLLPALLLLGCAGFVNNTRKAEYASLQLADAAMKGYAAYWKEQTNSTGANMPALWQQRSNVVSLARKVGTAEVTLDTALTIYATNSAAGKPLVDSAIAALTGSAGELNSTVLLFEGKAKPLFTPLNP